MYYNIPLQNTNQEDSKRGKRIKKLKKQKTMNKMALVSLYLLIIITLNINKLNSLTLCSKDLKWLNGEKNKIQQYAAYKRLTLALSIHIGRK